MRSPFRMPLLASIFLLVAAALPLPGQTPSLPSGQRVLVGDYLQAPTPQDTAGLIELAQNCDLLILHEWSDVKIPTLRQANPDIVILLYKNRGMALNDSEEAVANYYDFDQYTFAFMHRSNGSTAIWDYNFDGRLDYASPLPELDAWQDLFLDRALADVRAGGWDGLLVDDLWTYETPYALGDIREYSGNIDLQNNMADFLAEAHRRTQQEGVLLAGNIGWWRQSGPNGMRAGELFLQHLDIGMEEKFFVQYGVSWDTGSDWYDEIQRLNGEIDRTGNAAFFFARGDTYDRSLMLYSLASYLCISDGDGNAAFQYGDPNRGGRMPPFYAENDIAENLGNPVGDVQWHSGYRIGYRPFSNGYVVVNPNSTSRTISELNGFYNVDGQRISGGATLPGYTGGLYFRNY